MADANPEFMGTSEEVRILMASADMAIERGDIDGAVKILSNISSGQQFYLQGKEKLALIYLNLRKNKRLYISCYSELMEKNNTAHTCMLLGDAYMSIQEPEKAIVIYESALKKNPRDGVLASKIGSTLSRTHDYTKAINYSRRRCTMAKLLCGTTLLNCISGCTKPTRPRR